MTRLFIVLSLTLCSLAPLMADGIPIERFVFEYEWDNEANLSVAELQLTEVALSKDHGHYSAPATADRTASEPIRSLARSGVTFDQSALQRVLEAVVAKFHTSGIFGVYVYPDPRDLNAEGEDIREAGQTNLRLRIRVPVVANLHTVGKGDRWSGDESVDNPVHKKILKDAPVAVGGFILKDQLDNYVHYLNRHPGRQVHMSVAPSEDHPGRGAQMDLVLDEAKQWNLFFHVANTGTKSTRRHRETFGFRHNQLTNNDDILVLTYTTAGFQDSHTAQGSYEFDFPGVDRLRAKLGGQWSMYEASDLGFASMTFEGKTYQVLGEMIWNAWQCGSTFVDVAFGGRYQHVRVEKFYNGQANPAGDEDFFFPYAAVRLERFTNRGNTTGFVQVEGNWSALGGTDKEKIVRFGRSNVEKDWITLKGEVTHSCFLEELFNKNSDRRMHLVEFALRGQTTFGDRVPPQFMQAAGGMYSVRGYPEGASAGDSVLEGSAEYRLYLTNVLPKARVPKGDHQKFGRTFRWLPTENEPADWGLILSAFTEYAHTMHHSRQTMEADNDLWGAGVGAELLIWNCIRIRGDLAVALKDVVTGTSKTDSGDIRGHVSAAVIY